MKTEIDAPAASTSADLVFHALAMRKATHTAYLVWRLLESCVASGQLAPTNGALGAQLDVNGRTVRLAIALLQGCGLLFAAYDARAQTRVLYLYPFGHEFADDLLRAIAAGRLVVDPKRNVVVDQATKMDVVLPEWMGVTSFHPPLGFMGSESTVSAATASGSDQSAVNGELCTSLELVVRKYTDQSAMKSASTPVPENRISTRPRESLAKASGPRAGRPVLPITADMRLVHANWSKAVGRTRVRSLAAGPLASNIRARLADGFSVADMQLVAEWAAQDPWLNGTDPRSKRSYLGIETLYRSQAQTDRYLEQAIAWKSGKLGGFDRRQVGLSAHLPSQGDETF